VRHQKGSFVASRHARESKAPATDKRGAGWHTRCSVEAVALVPPLRSGKIMKNTMIVLSFCCALAQLFGCSTTVKNPMLDQSMNSNTKISCTKDCDETQTKCVAKCNANSCEATCHTDHDSCLTECDAEAKITPQDAG
jgi:hypothetical protein